MKLKCSFKPYEGDLPYIFVSYCHRDSDRVYPVLEYLHQKGFRIWYDDGIEWGTEWPQSIAEHLLNCSVCMAFHSSGSIQSPNCKHEIYYAIKKERPILSVYLEEVVLPEGLEMQLSSFQETYKYQYEEEQEFLSRVRKLELLQSCGEIQAADTDESSVSEVSEENILENQNAEPAKRSSIWFYLILTAAGIAGSFVFAYPVRIAINHMYEAKWETIPPLLIIILSVAGAIFGIWFAHHFADRYTHTDHAIPWLLLGIVPLCVPALVFLLLAVSIPFLLVICVILGIFGEDDRKK